MVGVGRLVRRSLHWHEITKMYNIAIAIIGKNMTTLLQQAIAEIEQLSPEEQDAIASRFLDEIRDEQEWQIRFAKTTDDQWDSMAEMVRQQIASSKIVPIKNLFPS